MLRRITPELARSLGWYNGERAQLIVRACFFLGYGNAFIAELVANPMRSKEADIIIDSAIDLGMTDEDEVQILPVQGDLSVRRRRSIESIGNDRSTE